MASVGTSRRDKRASGRALDGFLEAIYSVEASEHAWLTGIVAAARPILDDGAGLGAWTFRLGTGTVFVETCVENATVPLMTMALELSTQEPALQLRAHFGRPVATFSEHNGRAAMRRSRAVEQSLHARGVEDFLGVLGKEPDGWGVAIGIPLRQLSRIRAPRRAFLERISAHLQAAHRLQRRLAASSAEARLGGIGRAADGREMRWSDAVRPSATEPVRGAFTQAILDPSGRVVEAEGVASERSARGALSRAAIAADRARARILRGDDDDDALREWRALVDGRWSLVSHFDTDGRRFLLARCNAPGTIPHSRLDERERAVLGYRAAGHPLKLIAYEMGFSITLTSLLVNSAMRKLGIRSVTELVPFTGRGPRK